MDSLLASRSEQQRQIWLALAIVQTDVSLYMFIAVHINLIFQSYGSHPHICFVDVSASSDDQMYTRIIDVYPFMGILITSFDMRSSESQEVAVVTFPARCQHKDKNHSTQLGTTVGSQILEMSWQT